MTMKFYSLSFIIALYSAQILDHVSDSIGQSTSGAKADVSSSQNFLPVGQSAVQFAPSQPQPIFIQPQPVFIQPQPVFAAPAINADNTNTHSDAGLLQIVNSGAGSGVAKVGLFSN